MATLSSCQKTTTKAGGSYVFVLNGRALPPNKKKVFNILKQWLQRLVNCMMLVNYWIILIYTVQNSENSFEPHANKRRAEISVCKKGWVRSMRHTFIKKKIFAISNTLRASRNIFLDVFFIATMEYYNKIVAMNVTLFHGEDIFSARRRLLHSAVSTKHFIWGCVCHWHTTTTI